MASRRGRGTLGFQRVRRTIFHRGAEADLFLSRAGPWDVVEKQRIRKKYRDPKLDLEIRRERTGKEAYALHIAKKAGVRTPTIVRVDLQQYLIVMTRVRGVLARDNLDRMSNQASSRAFRDLGCQIGLLHMNGIVHGDLTTSNIIISDNGLPFVLDFGMSSHSVAVEDRGVDLHLLRRSITATHLVDADHCTKGLLDGYRAIMGPRQARQTFRKAAEIARRGRYFALR